MTDPRYSMHARSLQVLLEDTIDASLRKPIEPHELVFNTKEEFYANTWPMGEVYSDYASDNEDDNEMEFDRTGCYRPNEVYGSGNWCDPAMVLKFTNANLGIVISLAESLVDNDELMGAGIIITDNEGNYYNPLHPLCAAETLKRGGFPFKEFTILFYPATWEENAEEQSIYKAFIKDIVRHTTKKLDKRDYMSEDPEVYKRRILNELQGLPFSEQVERDLTDSNQPMFIVTPVSVIDLQGVIYPYYGVIESKFNGRSYQSRNLAPMCTGNVQYATDMDRAYDDVGSHKISSGINFDTTCIGTYSPTEHTNLRHMNIMNVQSMYMNEVINEDYTNYVYQNIKMSIEILKQLQGVQDGQSEKISDREDARTEQESIRETEA